MRGVGGPLLCIGDLLSDVEEIDGGDHIEPSSVSQSLSSSSSSSANSKIPLPALDLSLLFQENYKLLNEALSESGHSWTGLTIKLCNALDTADKLIQSANSDAKSLSEKVGILQNIVRRGNSAVKEVKVINGAANIEKRSSALLEEKVRSK